MNKLLTMISAVALLTAIAGSAYADQHEKTVFITSAKFKGDLGGLAGADDKCQAEADSTASIVPSGTYLAWLSDGFDSPDVRFTKSVHPYMLLDGTKIAEDFADLTDGSILHAINIDATGKRLHYEYIWTGTKADGKTADYTQTCDGWMANPLTNFNGMAGQTNLTSTVWSSRWSYRGCGNTINLICFQQ
jgi:hypothetical protein